MPGGEGEETRFRGQSGQPVGYSISGGIVNAYEALKLASTLNAKKSRKSRPSAIKKIE
jgi:hypothetical protein